MDVPLLTGIDVIKLPAARWDSDYFEALKAASRPNREWEIPAAASPGGAALRACPYAISGCVISSYKQKRGRPNTLLRR